ncbi:hypothetical protein CAP35_06350 [Chitinophagaceae bacterium IBVUCB1]|nr:hypothetical protein CAP35_06350 [Chitinophagaceae bacterium IBVUCB1]
MSNITHMRFISISIVFVFLFACSAAIGLAQTNTDTIEYFMDYDGKTCGPDSAYYYRLAYKEGKWWKVKDFYTIERVKRMDGYFTNYADGKFDNKQGMFFFYHPNGSVANKVRYINNMREGLYKAYNENGKLIDSALFIKGKLVKFRYKWNDNGDTVYIGRYDADGSGEGYEEHFFDDGVISARGKIIYGEHKDSVWTYYHNNGKLSCAEVYEYGRCTDRKCYNINGGFEGDCEEMTPPYTDAKRNNRYHIEDADLLDMVQADYVTFTVKVLIDKDGKVLNAEMITKPQGTSLFYKQAIEQLMHMPRWIPGKEHNRPAKMYTNLLVTIVRSK